jgi:hypothetical protein
MGLLTAAILLAQAEAEEVHIDPAEEGLKVITGMLITGLIFISVIVIGQTSKWLSHRRKARRRQAY